MKVRNLVILATLLFLVAAIPMAAQTTGTHTVDVQWGAPTDGTPLSIYKVYRAAGSCATAQGFVAVQSVTGAFAATDDKLPQLTTYCYYVTQSRDGMESVPSNKSEATTRKDPPPNAPSGFTATPGK